MKFKFFKFIKRNKLFENSLGIYYFVYDGMKRKNNILELILNDKIKFKNYYLNYDLPIDEKDISKYKKN